jgi:hypothetical protein
MNQNVMFHHGKFVIARPEIRNRKKLTIMNVITDRHCWRILNLPNTKAELTVYWFTLGRRWWSHYHDKWWKNGT